MSRMVWAGLFGLKAMFALANGRPGIAAVAGLFAVAMLIWALAAGSEHEA